MPKDTCNFSFKSSMLIKLICACVIPVEIKQFPLFLFFQSIQQGSTYPFDFAAGICRKKYDFTIRIRRKNLGCTIDFKIPKISAIGIQQNLII